LALPVNVWLPDACQDRAARAICKTRISARHTALVRRNLRVQLPCAAGASPSIARASAGVATVR
jgi:hypothetical protein